MADSKLTIQHKVWTFIIRGGADFSLRLPNNPPLDHDGRMSMWKMVGTKRIADAACGIIKETGASVELHTEHQNEEQAAIRKSRLGIEDADI